VSFKFESMDKHSVCLFICFICCFACFCLYIFVFCLFIKVFILFYFVAMLLIEHDLHHNCGLHVIGVFNLFEHCISLEISVFDSCVGLERLHLLD
jgi:hypothetical protein